MNEYELNRVVSEVVAKLHEQLKDGQSFQMFYPGSTGALVDENARLRAEVGRLASEYAKCQARERPQAGAIRDLERSRAAAIVDRDFVLGKLDTARGEVEQLKKQLAAKPVSEKALKLKKDLALCRLALETVNRRRVEEGAPHGWDCNTKTPRLDTHDGKCRYCFVRKALAQTAESVGVKS